jgi:hypothetical protein
MVAIAETGIAVTVKIRYTRWLTIELIKPRIVNSEYLRALHRRMRMNPCRLKEISIERFSRSSQSCISLFFEVTESPKLYSLIPLVNSIIEVGDVRTTSKFRNLSGKVLYGLIRSLLCLLYGLCLELHK